ncbi:ISAs1 family transposase [Streptomyces sp. NPDC033753]|uniref:ISAs1 family transposase n=1 Tax=Streptomyces sp. NPDC033753 TaxID=3155128 RepID=UPI0033C8FBD9
MSVKNNQPTLAGQLTKLPWRQVPVLEQSRDRGHGREEFREAKVVSVNGLLFPHARQVARIHRKRRRIGTSKRQTETVYAGTDLAAHQASRVEIAAWARGHWIIENTVHWTKDVTFAEDASQIRRHRTPAVMSALRELARATLHRSGWANIASGRRAHTHPAATLTLSRDSVIKPGEQDSPRGPGIVAVRPPVGGVRVGRTRLWTMARPTLACSPVWTRPVPRRNGSVRDGTSSGSTGALFSTSRALAPSSVGVGRHGAVAGRVTDEGVLDEARHHAQQEFLRVGGRCQVVGDLAGDAATIGDVRGEPVERGATGVGECAELVTPTLHPDRVGTYRRRNPPTTASGRAPATVRIRRSRGRAASGH